MTPHEHCTAVMLPHLIGVIAADRDYAEGAVRDYFELCPWAKLLIGDQLREAWKAARMKEVA